MAKRRDKPWQFKFSFALSLVMLTLILGYFVQAFLEVRKVKPVRVAMERVIDSREKPEQQVSKSTSVPKEIR